MGYDPFLYWVGTKKWLVPEIVKYFHPSCRLVEPFCGGLSMSLGLLPERACLNDVDDLLINMYRYIQEESLLVENLPNHDKNSFLNAREEFNDRIRNECRAGRRMAELYFYLNVTCHHGLYRVNSKGEFNTAYGYRSSLKKPNFRMYQYIFKTWEFMVNDFENIDIREDDFIYADPPYDVEPLFYNNNFDWDNQVRLAEFLGKQSVPTIISNEPTDRIISLYKDCGMSIYYIESPRKFAIQHTGRAAKELLAFKNIEIQEIPTLF